MRTEGDKGTDLKHAPEDRWGQSKITIIVVDGTIRCNFTLTPAFVLTPEFR